MMSRYLLQRHVHLCVSAGQIVMLDLRRDEYLGFGPTEAQALSRKIDGWPVRRPRESSAAEGTDGSEVEKLLASMSQRDLITADGTAGKTAIPATVPSPSDAVLVNPFPRIRASHLAAFASAWVAATVALRIFSIEVAVRRVQKRKPHGKDGGIGNCEKLTELVSVFAALRPFLFTAKDECLFDSLALIEFLSRHGLYPSWVIGVQAHPFAAHSWVQHGHTVLNDYPEHVLKYVPILVV